MITEEKRIEWLLELQEHPEQLTDEQLQQILADDEMRQLVQQLGFAKRAFKCDELKNDTLDVDTEWEKFAASHANELTNAARAEGKLACTMPYKEEEDESQLDTLDEEKPKSRFLAYVFTHKVAASFIGALLASGIAFAAIQVVSIINTSKPQQPTTEQAADIESATSQPANKVKADTISTEIDIDPVISLPTDTVKIDTIPVEPYIFNNVPLDSMLTTIAAAYGGDVEFENEAARELRFHFVWKREDSLTHVVEKLNTFEAVNIVEEDKMLVVK